MITRLHFQKNLAEFTEFHILFRLQRMFHEEWNDVLKQMPDLPHPVCHQIAVVVSYHTTAKMTFQGMKYLHIALLSNDSEFRYNPESASRLPLRIDSDMETTCTVNKSRYPLCFKFHRQHPNVKSLRIPIQQPETVSALRKLSEHPPVLQSFPGLFSILNRSFLRIVPMSPRFLLKIFRSTSTEEFWRSFPHMVRFY